MVEPEGFTYTAITMTRQQYFTWRMPYVIMAYAVCYIFDIIYLMSYVILLYIPYLYVIPYILHAIIYSISPYLILLYVICYFIYHMSCYST